MADRNELGQFEPGTKIRLRYKTAEDLQTAVEAFFIQCEAKGLIPTYSGLASHLTITREALYRMKNHGDDYAEVVQMAKTKIEADLEQRLISGKGGNVVGIIWATKNFGWSDRVELKMDSRNVSLTGFKLIDPNGSQD
jgi:hypothetical protein